MPVLIEKGIVILLAGVMFVMGSFNISKTDTLQNIEIHKYGKEIEVVINYPDKTAMEFNVDTTEEEMFATYYMGFRDKHGNIITDFLDGEGVFYKDKANIKYKNYSSWYDHLTKEQQSKIDKATKTILIPDNQEEMKELIDLANKK